MLPLPSISAFRAGAPVNDKDRGSSTLIVGGVALFKFLDIAASTFDLHQA
jgi:hypothetical protein